MSDATQPPADVRGKILRASILPFEDEETLIAGLRAGAEAVERGELDAEDFAGVWSQYLRQLLRASSVPAPADVRERVAKAVYLWEATRFGAAESWALRSWEQESNTRRELYFNVADRILALFRTPRGEGEGVTGAWATVEAAALAQANLLDSHYGGQRAQAAEIRNAVAHVAAFLRAPRGEGEAKFDVGDPVALRLAASKLEASGYDVLPLRLRMIADQIKCVIAARRSKAQGDAEALAAADMERVPTPQEER